ncbi:hypothetical protein O3P69_020754 [Scylla paramamosain]|uniref:Uncharacterized protein n=1 Tax=Scylla paramamosain TaxID=85552 RepID=A0AAW0TN92_SCYPA
MHNIYYHTFAGLIMSRETVTFAQSGPTPVCVDEGTLPSRTGCYVITLTFPQPTQVGEITFRNHYTWAVGVHVLRATSSTSSSGGVVGAGLLGGEAGGDAAWVWKDPAAWQSRIDWQDVIGMRLVLRQPSPVWRTFFIEEITAYRELPRLPPFSVPIITQDGQSSRNQQVSIMERLAQQTKCAMLIPDDSLEGGLSNGGYDIAALQYTS